MLNKCWCDFPLYVPTKPGIFFLQLAERRLIQTSSPIKCSLRPTHTSILDKLDKLWLVDQNGSLTVKKCFILHSSFAFPCIRGFNSKLMQVSISSKTIRPGHDLKGAKTLPLGQSLCTKTLPSGQNRESKAPPLGHKVCLLVSINSDTI